MFEKHVMHSRSQKLLAFTTILLSCGLAGVYAESDEGFLSIAGSETTFKIIREGDADAPAVEAGDSVTVHAIGILRKTGKEFWNTRNSGQEKFTYTAKDPPDAGDVINGWEKGARGMKRGEVRRLHIPFSEGYGTLGYPSWGIEANADLVFELEVDSIQKAKRLGPQDLNCEACQLICVMLQEKVDEIEKAAGKRSFAASEAMGAAMSKKRGPCALKEAWEPIAEKLQVRVDKAQLGCSKQLEKLEDSLEAALSDPTVKDRALRERICLAPKKKPACKTLWDDEDVPVSKEKASRLKAEAQQKENAESSKNERLAVAFFKENAKRNGVIALKSGLQVKHLTTGNGPTPKTEQKVKVHYRGLLIDCIPQDGDAPCNGGTEFDSTFSCKEGTPSAERSACEKNAPISFTAAQAGSFWPELFSLMKEGGRAEAYVPHKLAYGSIDDPSKRPALVGPKAALIFQVEILEIEAVAESPKSDDLVEL
eukprot:TRINITY_DN3486_c2_g1_i1.p1 TRINITY_DN3486_c2_g1~~TRINITY_DN3486_c2_g1_i1.p1  ORF type:complete len:481 (-),score=109.65 TRINITY_DN3486_c2_g1_i1:302-1744(-)